MESEFKIIIQMLKNMKEIINTSKERNCWKEEELKNIEITYHNISEVTRQLQEKDENFDVSKEPEEMNKVD